MKTEQGPESQFGPDPRECPYELPPIERRPLADDVETTHAIRRMIEQAQRERAAGSKP